MTIIIMGASHTGKTVLAQNRLDNMNEITIKALSPDLEKDYFDFFDNRAFSDGSPYYPCYCNAFNMSAGEIEAMRNQAKRS